MTLFIIFADNEPDQVVETRKLAEREARDLRGMGFAVRIREVSGWNEANKIMDKDTRP